MDQIQRFENDLQVEQEALLLDLGNIEPFAAFIASVAVSGKIGNGAITAVQAQISRFKDRFGESELLRLENAIYKNFRNMRRAGLLPNEDLRLRAEDRVEKLFKKMAPN